MTIFRFTLDQKVKIWERTPIEIEAENKEAAIKKLCSILEDGRDITNITNITAGKSEFLKNTKKKILPKENNGNSSTQLFFGDAHKGYLVYASK